MPSTRFAPGRIVATPAAIAAAGDERGLAPLLDRHLDGDWGDVPPEDAAANERALSDGGRLLSAYIVEDARLLVLTEADRSATTVLLSSEY